MKQPLSHSSQKRKARGARSCPNTARHRRKTEEFHARDQHTRGEHIPQAPDARDDSLTSTLIPPRGTSHHREASDMTTKGRENEGEDAWRPRPGKNDAGRRQRS